MMFSHKIKSEFWFCKLNMTIGILCILYCIFGYLVWWGIYFGMKAMTVFGLVLIGHSLLSMRAARYKNMRFKRYLDVLIVMMLLMVIIFEGLIGQGMKLDQGYDPDYIIVLGAGIIDDQPTLELKSRLDGAIDYLNTHQGVQKVVLCGGKGPNEDYSEAEVMAMYMIRKGIDPELLIKEGKSRTTFENIEFGKDKLDEIETQSTHKVLIVSNDFHLYRAKQIAQSRGLVAGSLATKTPIYIVPNHHVREYFAIMKWWAMDLLLV